MCPAVPTKLPAPTKPGAGVVIALPTAAFACIAAPVGELPATPVFLSMPCSPSPSILFIVGDPTGPTCSEFIPSALPWPLLGRPEFASPIFLVFEGPKIDPSKRPPLGRRSWHGWQRGTQCHQNTMSGREDRKRFYNTFCISSNLSNCCYLIQVSSPHPLLYSCKLPKGEYALFYGVS